MIETTIARPVPVSGTTWVITGTPSATMTATDATQDGATTIRTPPMLPRPNPRSVHPVRSGRPRGRLARSNSLSKSSGRGSTQSPRNRRDAYLGSGGWRGRHGAGSACCPLSDPSPTFDS